MRRTIAVCMLTTMFASAALATEPVGRLVSGGLLEIRLDEGDLASVGLAAVNDSAAALVNDRPVSVHSFTVSNAGTLGALTDGSFVRPSRGAVDVQGSLMLTARNGAAATFDALTLTYDPFYDGSAYGLVDPATGERAFDLVGVQPALSSQYDLTFTQADIRLSNSLAQQLGMPQAAGQIVGTVALNAPTVEIEIPALLASQEGNEAPMDPLRGGFPTTGADVIVGELPATAQFGRIGAIGSGTLGLAIGTTSCNKGDTLLNWYQMPDTRHPVIAQNLYRYTTQPNGVKNFEQIGQSWLKHGFCALQGTVCFACTPAGSCCCTRLGSGCSDPYDVSLNATQSRLGGRSYVNPWTGAFPSSATNKPSPTNGVDYRMQVQEVDLVSGAQYFSEGQYVASDDSSNFNTQNNASHRKISVSGPNGSGTYSFNNAGPTVREQPAIFEWTTATHQWIFEGEGYGVVSYEVTDLGNGTWHYEYAVYNMNIAHAFGSFSVPVGNANITNVGFHKPLNHGQEQTGFYSNDPWDVSQANGVLTWSTESSASNINANALRWGSLTNFRFDADAPPQAIDAELGRFFGSTPYVVSVMGPASTATCPGDLNNSGDVNLQDLGLLLSDWGNPGPGDLDGSGIVDLPDLGVLLANWGCQI